MSRFSGRRRSEGRMVTTLVRKIGTTPCWFIRSGRRAEAVRGVGTGGKRGTAGLGVRGGDGGQLRLVLCCKGDRVHHHSSGERLLRTSAKSIPWAGRSNDKAAAMRLHCLTSSASLRVGKRGDGKGVRVARLFVWGRGFSLLCVLR